MKKIISLLLILCMVLFLAACGQPQNQPDSTLTNQTDPQSNPASTSQTNLPSAPEATTPTDDEDYSITAEFLAAPTPGTEPTEPEQTQTVRSEGAGINLFANLLNCGTPKTCDSGYGADLSVYPDQPETVQAEIEFSRYVDPKNRPAEDFTYTLLVLADGVPTKFTVDGESYLQYPLSIGEEREILTVELSPEFSLNLGRLDFMTIFTGTPSWSFPANFTTLWIAQKGELIRPSTTMETKKETAAGGMGYSYTLGGASLGIKLPRDGEAPFEADVNEAGLFRTLIFYNDRPLTFTVDGKERPYLDWETDGEQVLRFSLHLPEVSGDRATVLVTTLCIAPYEEISERSTTSLLSSMHMDVTFSES